MSRKSEYISKAKYCEEMERYEKMAELMKEAAECGTDDGGEIFDQNERNLFSVAYKNVVGTRRSAWRVVSAKEEKLTDLNEKEWCGELRKEVEKELEDTCNEVLGIIDTTLLTKAEEDQTKVFYLKMKGDYYRYLAEIKKDKEEVKTKAEAAYKEAQENAETLPTTHPIRLGLALNFSVFYYEIMSKQDKACSLAKQAFDDAIADLDTLKEDSYKDSTLIMQLLRDNLTLWTSNEEPEDEGN